MGYEGAKVAEFVRHTARETREHARDLAVAGRDRQTERTRENTPVDTSLLRDSIFAKTVLGPFIEPSAEVYVSGVETDVDYAPYMEEGTGLWGPKGTYIEIRPKKPGGVLRFHPYVRGPSGTVSLDRRTGNPLKATEPVYAKVVMHPGSPGHHMFALGAAMAEHEFGETSAPVLRRWVTACERWKPGML